MSPLLDKIIPSIVGMNGVGQMASAATATTGPPDKFLRFDSIRLIEFLPAIGDNPSCSSGVPISLSDEVVRLREINIDQYEQKRKPRRALHEMLIARDHREDILVKVGYQSTEILDAIRRSRKIRRAREKSFHTIQWDPYHEVVEGFVRHVLRMVGIRKSCKSLFLEMQKKRIMAGQAQRQ